MPFTVYGMRSDVIPLVDVLLGSTELGREAYLSIHLLQCSILNIR